MDFVDYYKILGLVKTATARDIKNSYRKLARKFHPDLNPNNTEAKANFQQINEANDVLSDPVKRKKYDKYGADWKHADEFEKRQKQQTSDADRAGYPGFQSESSYSDFFESMFGGSTGAGRSRQVKYRGEDYHTEIQLNLTDAYVLQRKTLSVNGKNIRITIPAGIENGQILKIASHGSPGLNGGPSGDLYVSISVLNNPDLKRLAENLYKTVHLNLYTAILGGEITIETLNGKVKIKVKAGTQNGSTVKLKGKGFPVYKNEGNYGDMFVTYSITIPTNLTEKQKNIFAELSQD